MGRNHNQMVTTRDIRWMQDNGILSNRFLAPLEPDPNKTLPCLTVSDINIYIDLDDSLIPTYTGNQLVPYQKIREFPSFNTGGTTTFLYWGGDENFFSIYDYFDLGWSLTWKLYYFSNGSFVEDPSANWFHLQNWESSTGVGSTDIDFFVDFNPLNVNRRVVITINNSSKPNSNRTFTQERNIGVNVEPIELTFSSTSLSDACQLISANTYYIKQGDDWLNTERLYSKSDGTQLAPTGYYGGVADNGSKYSRRFVNNLLSVPFKCV